MIKIANEVVNKTLLYLERNYPREKEVYINIISDCDAIETPDGTGFAVFIPNLNRIYVAADIPEPEINLVKNIAHEYKHYMQMCDGESYNETEAEEFAEKIYDEIMKQ